MTGCVACLDETTSIISRIRREPLRMQGRLQGALGAPPTAEIAPEQTPNRAPTGAVSRKHRFCQEDGGQCRARTCDLLLVRQAL